MSYQTETETVGHNGEDVGKALIDPGPARTGAGSVAAEGYAHDIYNLMTVVVGNAALLRTTFPSGHPAVAKLETIERAAEQASQLTRQLLALSQGARQKTEPVNLNTIVYHVLLSEEQQLAPRIRIVRYINPDVWKVAAYQSQIEQVVLELATNAIEAIEGAGRVYIGTRNVDLRKEPVPLGADLKAGRYVLLSVEDNGPGMTPEVRTRIFEPGFTTKAGRRGMGLTNIFNIVTSYGGYISVNSVRDHGTVFRVYFPAYEEVREQPPAPAEQVAVGTETVLIVDDEQSLVDVAQETLTRLGYRTLVAHDGAEAVDLARAYPGPIHLALLDLVMPVMGGAEAYPLLREIRPNMRILICTGLEQETVSPSILEDEFAACLLKPFRPSILAQEVRKALDEPLPRTPLDLDDR